MTIKFDWVYDLPDWDSLGTITASWIAEVGDYVARIDYFHNADGSGYAYTVTFDGNPIRGGENEPAESFEAAEHAIRRLLAERL